ncbi:hypothetical protein PIB30_089158 [Stylosanthes scabra]|uniref:Uncharacterized protein n=1 Tax=Stylosanthes scabra TaxID=79078 RepID=A0ABU6WWS0_9FABA|nr:hypothetical protein [Stylosanthes scabra]
MYALALKGRTSPNLLTAFSSSLTPQGNQDKQQFFFDSEIERTLRKLKKQTKASRQLNFEEVEDNNMAADPRRTLGDYTIPSTASCGSSICNGVTSDAIKIRLFPFSLRDKAKQWLNSQPQGSITT